jgi:hypothetical protein
LAKYLTPHHIESENYKTIRKISRSLSNPNLDLFNFSRWIGGRYIDTDPILKLDYYEVPAEFLDAQKRMHIKGEFDSTKKPFRLILFESFSDKYKHLLIRILRKRGIPDSQIHDILTEVDHDYRELMEFLSKRKPYKNESLNHEMSGEKKEKMTELLSQGMGFNNEEIKKVLSPEYFSDVMEWRIHHVYPREVGGRNSWGNLCLIRADYEMSLHDIVLNPQINGLKQKAKKQGIDIDEDNIPVGYKGTILIPVPDGRVYAPMQPVPEFRELLKKSFRKAIKRLKSMRVDETAFCATDLFEEEYRPDWPSWNKNGHSNGNDTNK